MIIEWLSNEKRICCFCLFFKFLFPSWIWKLEHLQDDVRSEPHDDGVMRGSSWRHLDAVWRRLQVVEWHIEAANRQHLGFVFLSHVGTLSGGAFNLYLPSKHKVWSITRWKKRRGVHMVSISQMCAFRRAPVIPATCSIAETAPGCRSIGFKESAAVMWISWSRNYSFQIFLRRDGEKLKEWLVQGNISSSCQTDMTAVDFGIYRRGEVTLKTALSLNGSRFVGLTV